MAMTKSGGSKGPTPWNGKKVLKFNPTAGAYEGQAVPQNKKCKGCDSPMAKDDQGVLYCPICKERAEKSKL